MIAILFSAFLVTSCLAGYLYHKLQKTKARDMAAQPSAPSQEALLLNVKELAVVEPEIIDDSFNAQIVNASGTVVMSLEELPVAPPSMKAISTNRNEINKLTHLATDLMAGAARISGKTVKVVFKPEIAQGLKDGTLTLMKTKAGEGTAIAIGSTSKNIASHGRIVQAGQAAQIASAAFAILSTAVAQSHLADIERSLSDIKRSISELKESIENNTLAEISGSLNYLNNLTSHIKSNPDFYEISNEKSIQLEKIIADTFRFANLSERDLESLLKKSQIIESADSFGSENTFHLILNHVERARIIMARYELCLQLSKSAQVIACYLDPTGKRYSRTTINSSDWNETVDRLEEVLVKKSELLIKGAIFNWVDTTEERHKKIESYISKYKCNNRKESGEYLKTTKQIDTVFEKFLPNSNGISLAITYDKSGVPIASKMLT